MDWLEKIVSVLVWLTASAVTFVVPMSAAVDDAVGIGPVYYGPPPSANCTPNSRFYGLNHCSGSYYGPPVAMIGPRSGHWHGGHFYYDDTYPKP